MLPAKSAPNLVQRLSRLPAAPQLLPLHGRKSVDLASCNTTFREKSISDGVGIDLLRHRGYRKKWSSHSTPGATDRPRTNALGPGLARPAESALHCELSRFKNLL